MEQNAAQNKRKKLFIAGVGIFLLIMAIIGYDISSRTTFPGSKGQLGERMFGGDSTATASDSLPAAD